MAEGGVLRRAVWQGHAREVMDTIGAMLTRAKVRHWTVEKDGKLWLNAKGVPRALKENIDAALHDETFKFKLGREGSGLAVPPAEPLPPPAEPLPDEAAETRTPEPEGSPETPPLVLDEPAPPSEPPPGEAVVADVRSDEEVVSEYDPGRAGPGESPEPSPPVVEATESATEAAVEGEITEPEPEPETPSEEEGPDAGATKSDEPAYDGGDGGGELHDPQGQEAVREAREGKDAERDDEPERGAEPGRDEVGGAEEVDVNLADETRNLRDTLTAKEAVGVIATMSNATALRTWRRQDGRVTVKRAIAKRLKALKELED